ncbi:MAG: hypothetical protein JW904_14420 [Spirochaetales bacterium]|nr:hypothetical protein [Spirochaetales bacterium]
MLYKYFCIISILLFLLPGGTLAAEGQAEDQLHRIMNQDDSRPVPGIAQLITPAERIGLFHLGMTKADLLLIIGDPDAVYDATHKALSDLKTDELYLLYKSLGLAFVLKGETLQKIITFSPQYRLETGLGIGSSQENVIKTYGTAFILSRNEQRDILEYKNIGIAFAFRKNDKTVWEVIVFSTSSP